MTTEMKKNAGSGKMASRFPDFCPREQEQEPTSQDSIVAKDKFAQKYSCMGMNEKITPDEGRNYREQSFQKCHTPMLTGLISKRLK